MPPIHPIVALVGLALLPALFSWLVAVVPSRRREASGLVAGNPLHDAPHASSMAVVSQPLVELSRTLSHQDFGAFVIGMKHLPVEIAAPLLARYVRSADPALQLYAQSILASGRDALQHQFTLLQKADSKDARAAAWMIEIGLALFAPSMMGRAERAGAVHLLAAAALERLQTCEHTPALVANAVRVCLAAGKNEDAKRLLAELPANSRLHRELNPAVAHALHQQRLA